MLIIGLISYLVIAFMLNSRNTNQNRDHDDKPDDQNDTAVEGFLDGLINASGDYYGGEEAQRRQEQEDYERMMQRIREAENDNDWS